MGSTQKPFLLYEGLATEDRYKYGGMFLKMGLPQLEKTLVTYSPDNFTIGNHNFQYSDIQSMGLLSLGPGTQRITNICIQIKHKDGKEFVLFPVQGFNDNGAKVAKKSEELFQILNADWQRVVQAESKQEQARVQNKLLIGAIDKIRKMLSVSTRLKLEMMQQVLGLDTATFNDKIFDWAAEFKFKIDGDYVVIEGGDVTGFISKLDAEFADWSNKDGKKA